jgi:hypothetical protein
MASEAALTPEAARSIAPHLFPPRTPIIKAQIEAGINVCLGIQRRAVTFGKRPFAACLLGPDNETVLLMHQSIDQVNHAEVYLPRSQHPSVSEEKTETDNEAELLSQISILPLFQSLPLAMHPRVDLGAMRHVLLHYLLGTYWKSGVCSEQ